MTDANLLRDDDGDEEGAPDWMRTFGDSLTLLLTFFVLLLTFSVPGDEELRSLGFGPLDGPGVKETIQQGEKTPLGGRRWRLIQSRPSPDASGEVPPLYGTLAPAVEASRTAAELGRVPRVRDSIRLDISLADLFAEDGALSRRGTRLLNKVHRACRAGPARVIVRTVSESAARRDLRRSLAVVNYLKERGATGHLRFDVSTDARLASEGPPTGNCRITILRT